jgi:hypothetical protein
MNKLIISGLLFLVVLTSVGQSVNFKGVVVDRNTLKPIENVTIINRGNFKGDTSDSTGLFSFKASVGDTILFHDLRYEEEVFVVPPILDDQNEYAIVQVMEGKTLVLEEVTVFSFPDISSFQKSFLEYTPQNKENIHQVQRDIMKIIRDHYGNDLYYYDSYANRRIYEVTGDIPPNNLINPLYWSRFLETLRKK